jgi:hypothetical protein
MCNSWHIVSAHYCRFFSACVHLPQFFKDMTTLLLLLLFRVVQDIELRALHLVGERSTS